MRAQIEQVLVMIPYGKVTSYGRVAQLLDMHFDIQTSGWMVGKIMNGILKTNDPLVPWWRVINKQGYISTNKLGHLGLIQRQLLEREGVEVINDTVDMKKYSWKE